MNLEISILMKILKGHIVAIALLIGTALLIIAAYNYPGGSSVEELSTSYSFSENYISDLLRPLAVNGDPNSARPFATMGTLFLSTGFGIFFIVFSQRIIVPSARFVIKYCGIAAMAFGFLTAFPQLHDIMVTLSSILSLIILFYITVFVVKSKLTFLKIMSILFLLASYFAAYMYFTRSFLDYMPLAQKLIYAIKIIWVLSLFYFTSAKDFKHIIR